MRKDPLIMLAAVTIVVCTIFLLWDFQHSQNRPDLNLIGTARAK